MSDAKIWNDPKKDKLWLYNLHYFDDLNAFGAPDRRDWHVRLMQRWVTENPPASGNGWESYPVSLRVVNWIKWSLAGNALPTDCQKSLYLQARWLRKRLEWHLLGNHLFANAKALVFSGLFFSGDEADSWLRKGLSIIARELPEQVLPDGGNFELSPMYHSIFLEDMLDLVNIASTYQQVAPETVSQWREVAARMLHWLRALLHPDGDIGLFNDAAIGIAPSFESLTAYATRLAVPLPPPLPNTGVQLLHLPDSGYVRLTTPQATALLDVARVGPDYLPGHAHADTLCFELSVFGRRLVVNGGTSRYGLGPERERERATAWHSTVEVNGENSSEVWSGFRVGRRAYPFDLQLACDNGTATAACSHDGYRWLPGKPVHRRSWQITSDSLTIHDAVSNRDLPASARFIFHPDVTVEQQNASLWHVTFPEGQIVRVTVSAGSGAIVDAWYAPEFGHLLATRCLAVQLMAGEALTCFEWS